MGMNRDVPCALCSALCDAHNAHNAHNANPCNLYNTPVINKNHNISVLILQIGAASVSDFPISPLLIWSNLKKTKKKVSVYCL